jgi:hypothetical protein
MGATSRIPVRLTDGDAMVRGLTGYDMLILQDPGQTAGAPQAIGLAERLCDRDLAGAVWPDVERILLAAYLLNFGARTELIALCTHCGETAEITPDLRDILADTPPGPEDIATQGWHIRSTPPPAQAMLHAALSAPHVAAQQLQRAMFVNATDPEGVQRPMDDIPAHLLDSAFARHNAAGLLIFEIDCPVCAARLPTRLDALGLLRAQAQQSGDIATVARTLSARLGMPLSHILELPDPERRSLSRVVAEAVA